MLYNEKHVELNKFIIALGKIPLSATAGGGGGVICKEASRGA